MKETMETMRKIESELNFTLTSDTMALILAQYWRECQVNRNISLREVMLNYLESQNYLMKKEKENNEFYDQFTTNP